MNNGIRNSKTEAIEEKTNPFSGEDFTRQEIVAYLITFLTNFTICTSLSLTSLGRKRGKKKSS